MTAFRFCLGRCGMIELDLRLSADGEVVVCHDPTLARTSNAVGFAFQCGPDARDALRVDAWPLARLRRLDMGGWFRCDAGQGGGSRFPAYAPQGREPMPTLAEVLAWSQRHAMPLNLELKGQGGPERDRQLAQTVARRIAAFGAADLVLLSSFHFRLLEDCLRFAPAVSRALLYDGPPSADLFDRLASLRACACHPEQHHVDEDLTRRLHGAGFFVNVWTVNDAVRQRALHALGVDGLITDFPALPGKSKGLAEGRYAGVE